MYTRPELAPVAQAGSLPPAQLQTRKEEAGWAGLSLAPQRGGQAKVGGRGQVRALGGGRGWGACFLSGHWRQLWAEGWPDQEGAAQRRRLLEAESASPEFVLVHRCRLQESSLTSAVAPAASIPRASRAESLLPSAPWPEGGTSGDGPDVALCPPAPVRAESLLP